MAKFKYESLYKSTQVFWKYNASHDHFAYFV